ncbi:hypothetical protein P20439_1382 [Pseudoalteromonas sp. BSi20439]|nr:hypothetical protein P20439_1382 [Pseudoalteromonas sp. BSi20439]
MVHINLYAKQWLRLKLFIKTPYTKKPPIGGFKLGLIQFI